MSTLQQIREAIEVKLRDQGNQVLTDAQFLTLINEAQQEWATSTDEVRRIDAFAAVATQFDYPAPSGIIKPIQSWYARFNGSPIECVSEQEFLALGGFMTPSPGRPMYLMLDGQNGDYRYRFNAPPSSSSATTTLNGGINASVTTITVALGTALRSPSGWVQIDNEKIQYSGITGNDLLICRRGMAGTTAATHSNGATVTQLDIFVSYSRLPTDLSAEGDIPEINTRWHKDLQLYVLAFASVLDGRPNEAQFYMQRWEQAKITAKRAIWRVQAAAPAKRTFGY